MFLVLRKIAKYILLLLLIIATARPSLAQIKPEVTGANQILEARNLIEANCPDCEGATEAGLRQGIALLNEALRNGYGSPASEYPLLAKAYTTLAFLYTAEGSVERRQLLIRKEDLFRQLLEKQPNDVGLLRQYSSAAKQARDFAGQVSALRTLLRIEPDNTTAHFELALAYIGLRQFDRGLAEARSAITSADQQHIDLYGGVVVDSMQTARRSGDANMLREDIRKRRELIRK